MTDEAYPFGMDTVGYPCPLHHPMGSLIGTSSLGSRVSHIRIEENYLPQLPFLDPWILNRTLSRTKARLEKEITPATNISSSSPDETVMPPPSTMADEVTQFQDLTKRIADSLQIPLEEVKESQHKLLNNLHMSSSACIAVPIKEALVDPAKTILQTPTPILSTWKRADKKTSSLKM